MVRSPQPNCVTSTLIRGGKPPCFHPSIQKTGEVIPKDQAFQEPTISFVMVEGCSCESEGDRCPGAFHDSRTADMIPGPESSSSSADSTSSCLKANFSAPLSTNDTSEGVDGIEIQASSRESKSVLCVKPGVCSCSRCKRQPIASLIQALQRLSQPPKEDGSYPATTFCPKREECRLFEEKLCRWCQRWPSVTHNRTSPSPTPKDLHSTGTFCSKRMKCQFMKGNRCDGCHRTPVGTWNQTSSSPVHHVGNGYSPRVRRYVSPPYESSPDNQEQPTRSGSSQGPNPSAKESDGGQALNIDKTFLKKEFEGARQIFGRKRKEYRSGLDRSKETREYLVKYDQYLVRLREEQQIMREAEKRCISITQEISALTQPFS